VAGAVAGAVVVVVVGAFTTAVVVVVGAFTTVVVVVGAFTTVVVVVGAFTTVVVVVAAGLAVVVVVGAWRPDEWCPRADAALAKPMVRASAPAEAATRITRREAGRAWRCSRIVRILPLPNPEVGGRWENSAAMSYFGGPADSGSPVALRPSLAGGLPFRLLVLTRLFSMGRQVKVIAARATGQQPLVRLGILAQRATERLDRHAVQRAGIG
jgi:hypothetical protein